MALVVRAIHSPVPRYALAVAADEAALANLPADQVADLACRAIASGPRPLPMSDDPPWFPNAVIALFYAERYGEAQALLDAAVAEARAAANGMLLPPLLALRAWLALRRGRSNSGRSRRTCPGRGQYPVFPVALPVTGHWCARRRAG